MASSISVRCRPKIVSVSATVGMLTTASLAGPDGFRLQETVWSQPQYLGESPPECWRSQLVANAVKATPLRPHSLNSFARALARLGEGYQILLK